MSKGLYAGLMREKFQIDLQVNPFLTQAKKVHGTDQIVESELEVPHDMGESEMLDTLTAGLDENEIEEGREKWAELDPNMASQQVHDMLDEAAEDMTFASAEPHPKREAAVKRAGQIMDRETGDSLSFKRIAAGAQVELTDEQGEVLDTLASNEFDTLLDTGEYVVL